MPRQAREKSETGIYHIILRGINRQSIFKDDEDKERLFETIEHYKAVSNYKIYGYTFMGNHFHLLLKETTKADLIGGKKNLKQFRIIKKCY